MIELKGLQKAFGDILALNGLTLSVNTGSIFGLIGSNGGGKIHPAANSGGRIPAYRWRSAGRWPAGMGKPGAESAAAVFSGRSVAAPASSILELGKRFSGLYPTWDEGYFGRLCKLFPVNEKARLGTLSKGNRRQAGILLALGSRPELLLLDELFDGLDPVVRHLTKKVLADEVADRRMTVVLASHNLREMEDFCDSLALLHKGGLVLEQELDEMSLCLHRFQAVFREMPEISALKEKICITSSEKNGSMLTFVARGREEEILEALDQFSPTFRESIPLSLEEVFISEMEAAGYDIDNILG